MNYLESKGFCRSLNPTIFGKLLILAIFSSLTFTGFSQAITVYQHSEDAKNYSIIERPGTGGTEYLKIGTLFGQPTGTPRARQGTGLHFMRVDANGMPLLSVMVPNYIVTMKFDFSADFVDVRAVDIVPYTYSESIVIMQARSFGSGAGGLYGNKDLIVVLKVNNDDGVVTGRYDLVNPSSPDGNYANLYATHAIYHGDLNDGNDYLYICGFDGMATELGSAYGSGYPSYIPGFVPSCMDKRILVLKFDINALTPAVVASRTWDFPWPSCSYTPEYPVIYDFDIAMRLVPMNDGTGDIFVTGSTNSDFAWESAPPTPTLTPKYGSATLVLKIDETNNGPSGGALETMALKPFIEHKNWTLNSPRDLDAYEYGFDAYPVAGGMYIFSNNFEPNNTVGYGVKNGVQTIRMTYVGVSAAPQAAIGIPYTPATPNSFVYNVYPSADKHRLGFPPVDYNWGTQIQQSTNPPAPGANDRLYMVGLQSNWFCTGPINGNIPPSITNINPFLAEFEPIWTPGSPSIVGLNNNYFWKTYFTQNGTGYFDDLGGGLSNVDWSTQFMSDNPSGNQQVVLTAPRWNNNTNLLHHKFIRTDQNGDIFTGNTDCDQSYQNCIQQYELKDIAAGWFFGPHTEDQPTINTYTGDKPSQFYGVSSLACDGAFGPLYKTTGITNVNEIGTTVFEVYPNPSQNYVNVKLTGDVKDEAPITIALYNVMGQHVAELFNGMASQLRGEQRMNIPSVASGIYILNITSGNKQLHTQRLTVE